MVWGVGGIYTKKNGNIDPRQRCAGWVAQRYLAGASLAASQIVLLLDFFTHLATDGTYFFYIVLQNSNSRY